MSTVTNGGRRKRKGEENLWTIMLYLSGDNNLSPEMVRAIADIKIQGVAQGVTFTIQYDPQSPGFKTIRYAITSTQPSAAKAKATKKRAEEDGPLPIPEFFAGRIQDEDSADPYVLARFIRWSVENYPSKYRMLILSGHGSGAVGDFLTDGNARLGKPGSLSIPELAKALRLAEKGYQNCEDQYLHEDHPERELLATALPDETLNSSGERTPHLLDILGMDSCLMGMAEVAHEVKDHVRYLVGSEGFVPNTGWPYSYLLKCLKEWKTLRPKHEKTPTNIANAVVSDTIEYYKQFIPAGVSFDMTNCDLARFARVSKAVKELTKAIALPDETNKTSKTNKSDKADNAFLLAPDVRVILDLVITAHWRTQSYKYEQYADLGDFCDRLKDATTRLRSRLGTGAKIRKQLSDISDACHDVNTAVKSLVGRSPGHTGPEFQHSQGLAVFFPWSTWSVGGKHALDGYGELVFPRNSGWAGFLRKYLKYSQRGHCEKDGEPMPNTQRTGVAFASSSGKHADGESKHADGESKHADGENKFADMIARLVPVAGGMLPWSMKNPPEGVNWPRRRARVRKQKA